MIFSWTPFQSLEVIQEKLFFSIGVYADFEKNLILKIK